MKRLVPICLLLLSIGAKVSFAQQTLVFSKPGPLDYTANISEHILREAYDRIGIEVFTEIFPAERALVMSNTGAVDGEVNRIKGLQNKYPDLVPIPVPINWIDGIVFTNKESVTIEGWESLRPYEIVLRIGAKFAENGTEGMNVTALATNDGVFKLLAFGRADVAVSTRIEGNLTIQKHGYKNIRIIEPPIQQLELFHYLHVKNAHLVPLITRELELMTAEGRIKQIIAMEFATLF